MAEGKILPYLDVPFQHASPRILKLMDRPASGERNLERIEAWRKACPEITIRSTFIAGFPGETEAEFQELLDFVEAAGIDRAGCFAYSPVEGAKANELPDALPDEVREERQSEFMKVQERVSRKRLKAKVGKTVKVLIDEVNEAGAVARSSADAPEIDGTVFIELPTRKADQAKLKVGEFVSVKVTGSDAHDLWGKLAA